MFSRLLFKRGQGCNKLIQNSCRLFSGELKTTALNQYHKEVLKGKMVPFAGYEMPVQYPDGIIKEHLHCRENVGIFDVSHMGQLIIKGKDAAAFLEYITVVDTQALAPGRASLSLITNEQGGIKDDTIITKVKDDQFFVVVNGACKDSDFKHMKQVHQSKFTGKDLSINFIDQNSLIAVQGPKSQKLMEDVLGVSLSDLEFMQSTEMNYKKANQTIRVSRCGYTGEDGFELSVPNSCVQDFVEHLQSFKGARDKKIAKFVGLGARDSLRLESGLCLYGNDIDETTSPVEAVLTWTISKRRKEEGGYIGSDVVKKHIAEGVKRKRCGFVVTGLPAREGVEIFNNQGNKVGRVTSGAPSPSTKQNIGMAYVELPYNKLANELKVTLRGKQQTLLVKKMPFVTQNYYKKA